MKSQHQKHAKVVSQRAKQRLNVLDSHKGGILGHDHVRATEIYLNISPDLVLDDFQREW